MRVRQMFIFIMLPLFLILNMLLINACASRTENDPFQYAQSSAITFKVKESLLRDPKVKSYHITVNTYKDTVTLGGYVASHEEEERAIEITRRVKGVKYVVDNMAIKNA